MYIVGIRKDVHIPTKKFKFPFPLEGDVIRLGYFLRQARDLNRPIGFPRQAAKQLNNTNKANILQHMASPSIPTASTHVIDIGGSKSWSGVTTTEKSKCLLQSDASQKKPSLCPTITRTRVFLTWLLSKFTINYYS